MYRVAVVLALPLRLAVLRLAARRLLFAPAVRLIFRACAALYLRQGRTQAFSPGPRAFVEGYRPPHSSTGTVHAGRGAVRQNLRARLRCLRRPKGRGRDPSESRAFVRATAPHTPAPERLTREGWRCVKICAPACMAMRHGGGRFDAVWSGEGT